MKRRWFEKLLTFEQKILQKIHGPVQNQIGDYKRRNNADLEDFTTNQISEVGS